MTEVQTAEGAPTPLIAQWLALQLGVPADDLPGLFKAFVAWVKRHEPTIRRERLARLAEAIGCYEGLPPDQREQLQARFEDTLDAEQAYAAFEAQEEAEALGERAEVEIENRLFAILQEILSHAALLGLSPPAGTFAAYVAMVGRELRAALPDPAMPLRAQEAPQGDGGHRHG